MQGYALHVMPALQGRGLASIAVQWKRDWTGAH
jgi:hypothetical protein